MLGFKNVVTVVRSSLSRVARAGKKLAFALVAAAGVGLSAAPARAEAVLDFTAVGSSITAELTPAIAAAMPVAGILLAAGIGWKLYRRFVR